MKTKVYLSDEGFGHIVRQRAIISELIKLKPELSVTLQTHQHIAFAKSNIKATHFIDRFNNIRWHKNSDSSPDIKSIREFYGNYEEVAEKYIRTELLEDYDFLISDFVYEAFEIADARNIPSFGVAHFTWDWFFSKLYPNPLKPELLNRFFDSA
ncbi:MAG: hypothetical protein ACJ76F_12890, partial [Bacteroidia bacterium]